MRRPRSARLGTPSRSARTWYPSNRISGLRLNSSVPTPAVRIRSWQRSATIPGATRAQTRAATAAISSSTYTPANETAIRGHFPANRHAAVTSVYGKGMNRRNSTPAFPVRAPNRRQASP
ncbi:hypothetical protein LzC2_42040 [Planctomycetes bacterium LzC2]|uniref:Uncharacterized protein n=1 Tax=Alienimonas chondri TaxID=2681879 RepID=A0ABX1VIY6_9PLAN|nr:hypothetical protein [Alienimonas chondri]